MGYIRGLAHGAVVGTVVGICIAPQPGKRTREQLSAFGDAARDGYTMATRTVQRVAPLAMGAVKVARTQIKKSRSEPEFVEEDSMMEGNVRIHNETNGRR